RAIAPPLTFTLSRSCSKTRVQLGTTEANASLISTRSMSRSVIPALPSTAWVASTGPSRWKCGPAPTCACATIRARGFSFSARAIRLDAHRIAAAPSEIREELPAVRGAGSVLAEGELPLVELLVVLVDEELPLPHELFAVLLGLPKSHRRRFGPRLLRRHVRRRDDLLRRVDQEEREDLAVPRTGGVREAERSDAVLQHVREGEAAARRGRRRAQHLVQRVLVLQAVDLPQTAVVVLFVLRVVARRAEVQPARGDVLAVPVVDAGRDDPLVEHPLDVPGTARVLGLVRGEPDGGQLDDDLETAPAQVDPGGRAGQLGRGELRGVRHDRPAVLPPLVLGLLPRLDGFVVSGVVAEGGPVRVLGLGVVPPVGIGLDPQRPRMAQIGEHVLE